MLLKEALEGKVNGCWGSSGRGVKEADVVAVVRCIGGGYRWAPCNVAGDRVDEGAVGTCEQVEGWPGTIG